MQLSFIDVETRGWVDVTKYGLYEHAADPDLRLLCTSYALGAAPVQTWRTAFADGETPEACAPVPDDLLEQMEDPDVKFVAWNAAYERVVLNAVGKHYGLPRMPLEKFICAAAWARCHNLPSALMSASRAVLPEDKQKSAAGKEAKWMWSMNHELLPEHAAAFQLGQVDYCERDVESMRDIWSCLLNPTLRFFEQYWTSERINDRGVMVDLDLIDAAIRHAPAVQEELVARLAQVAPGVKPRGPSLIKWLERELPEELHDMLWISKKKQKGTKFWTERRKSSDKSVRRRLLEELDDWEGVNDIREALDVYDEANRAAVSKYKAARARIDDNEGCLRGQFVYAGAGQTIRFSAHGVQLHNTLRDVPKNALEVIAKIKTLPTEVIPAETGMTVNTALSRVVRPMFVAEDDKMYVCGDWSSIEARVLPWLSDDPRAEAVLDVFREGRDIYKAQASGTLGIPEDQIDKEQRQIFGKVPVLALGYQGSVGAYAAMGRNYGVTLPEAQVAQIVKDWRAANPWAVDFWKKLKDAAYEAMQRPGVFFPAGRVKYVFVKELLGGSLCCVLPDETVLVYRRARFDQIEKDGKESRALIFEHPTYGVSTIYGGHLAENITQAVAGCVLRDALAEVEDMIVLHVHDELLAEVDEEQAAQAAGRLHSAMNRVPIWAPGLPLAADIEYGKRYKIWDGEYDPDRGLVPLAA